MDYIWWINHNEESEIRKYLYLLEGMHILSQHREKTGENYNYRWKLTSKGEKIMETFPALKELWLKRNIKELYENIEKMIKMRETVPPRPKGRGFKRDGF